MLTTIEKIFLLQDMEMLSQASADHLALLADLCEERIVAAGANLFRPGDACLQFYLLLEGRVKLEGADNNGFEADRGPVNFWSCLGRKVHTYKATCLEGCRLLVIGTEDLIDVLATEPGLSLAILQHHARSHPV